MSYSDIKTGLDEIYSSIYRFQDKIDGEVIQKLDKQIETIKSSKLTKSEIKKIVSRVSVIYSIIQETMVKSTETLKNLDALNGILSAKSSAVDVESVKKQRDKDNAVLDSLALKQLEEFDTKTHRGGTRRRRNYHRRHTLKA
jgi:ABC-type lipopolysaccharide export system ATPase subunit